MKALFYTATAVFIALAGLIAFFALQPPASTGGARIVVEIDASAMPAVAPEGDARRALDPYAGQEDKPSDTADQAPTADRAAVGSEPAPVPTAPESTGSAPAQQAEIPAPPAGTALAGLNQDRPLFREIAPETQQGVTEIGPDSPDSLAAAPADPVLPGANLAIPAPSPQEQELARPPAPAAAPAPVEARAPPPPPAPPPLPVRRPNDLSAASTEERVATTGGNWAGVQYASTEAAGKEAGGKQVRVALLLRGVGRNDQDAADAIGTLPAAVSLGFWPYAQSGQKLAARAREKGHEVIVQVPLEPADYPASSAGPDTLLTTAPPEKNAERLQAVLKRFDGHSGVTNLMGGKMLHTKEPLKSILEDVKARGLLYVGESTRSHDTAREVAREINLRFGAADVLIDGQGTPDAIDKSLARLIVVARQRGSAIGVGNANVVTVQQVQAWAQTLAAQGVTLVPVGVLTQAPGQT